MRDTKAPVAPDCSSSERGWKILRLGLGFGQMGAATVAATLLIRTGMSTTALLAVVVASTLTMVSVLLFGSRRSPR
jgi:hypothetical protein